MSLVKLQRMSPTPSTMGTITAAPPTFEKPKIKGAKINAIATT